MPKHGSEQEVYSRNVGYDMLVSYDANNRQEYVGLGFTGAAEGDTSWSIYKLTYDGTSMRMTSRKYADGSDAFDKSWTLKDTYTY